MKNNLIMLALCLLTYIHAIAQNNKSADDLIGTWLVQDGSGKVEIKKSGNKYTGRLVWIHPPLDENGKPWLDTKNPDKNLKTRPQLGLPLLNDFIYDGNHLWTDGSIYDPESGSTYRCKITMKSKETIEVRGYIGISLFGRTEVWKRCENVVMK